jgi:hypothetical protein
MLIAVRQPCVETSLPNRALIYSLLRIHHTDRSWPLASLSLTPIVTNSVGSLTPSSTPPNGRSERSGSAHYHNGLSSNPTLVQTLFEGVLTNETRCLTCETVCKPQMHCAIRNTPKGDFNSYDPIDLAFFGNSQVSSRDESFLDLSIDIEQNSSVTACLRQFSASEMLCQKNKFFCDSCCSLQEAEKRSVDWSRLLYFSPRAECNPLISMTTKQDEDQNSPERAGVTSEKVQTSSCGRQVCEVGLPSRIPPRAATVQYSRRCGGPRSTIPPLCDRCSHWRVCVLLHGVNLYVRFHLI